MRRINLIFASLICLLLVCQIITGQQNSKSTGKSRNTNQQTNTAQSRSNESNTTQQVEILTNDSIIALVRAGVDDEVIVTKVRTTKCNFDLSTQGIVSLNKAGISKRVLTVMINPTAPDPKPEAKVPAPEAKISTSAAIETNNYPTEIGIYIKDGDKWTEIQPEVINFKTGGVLKNFASGGLIKGDINGHINGTQSRNRIHTPLEFLIYVPEGIAITEYQLLKLRVNKDNREFRTVTGGVLHQSGGDTRDLLTFESKKVSNRTFIINLPHLSGAEYGFLPPGGFSSASPSSTLGKMYTFSVLE
jgi:hypothetical protein